MARKKIVLIIVEGPSDETALGIGLNQIFDKDKVYIHIMHGDITTRIGVNSTNIISKIGNDVKSYAKSQHYTFKDFKQIIHLVDTDGVYIGDENIKNDDIAIKPRYVADGIYTNDFVGISVRNKNKVENLYRLRTCGKIWNVPYRLYYMSCNLDHVLYDKRNSTDEEKENDAYAFAKKYKDDPEGFRKYICESDFSVDMGFKESWEFIEKYLNSLERHTNFNICINAEDDNSIE